MNTPFIRVREGGDDGGVSRLGGVELRGESTNTEETVVFTNPAFRRFRSKSRGSP